jgi:starch synthase
LVALYAAPKVWGQIQRNAMKQDVDWSASAAKYAALYESLSE